MISREVSRWGCGDGDSVQYAFLSGERRLYVHSGQFLTSPADLTCDMRAARIPELPAPKHKSESNRKRTREP